jgi:uncharacterized membrane protein
LRRDRVAVLVPDTLIDDTEVTLAFYGSIVYLAIVSAFGSQREQLDPTVAISAMVATATVLYIAHVFSALVPRVARQGNLHGRDVARVLRHDVPLLAPVVVPTIPLVLAETGTISVATGYRLGVRLTLALLFTLAVTLSRRDGLAWNRALAAGAVIIAVTIVVIWLESHVH